MKVCSGIPTEATKFRPHLLSSKEHEKRRDVLAKTLVLVAGQSMLGSVNKLSRTFHSIHQSKTYIPVGDQHDFSFSFWQVA